MYRCGFCRQPSLPREKLTLRTIEAREKVYPERTVRLSKRKYVDPGGVGKETVKNANVCPRCVAVLEKEEPNVSVDSNGNDRGVFRSRRLARKRLQKLRESEELCRFS